MNLFRIKVSRPGLPRFAFTGLFVNSFEASFQAQADWPGAAIAVIRITGANP